jgi:hypothetical protein
VKNPLGGYKKSALRPGESHIPEGASALWARKGGLGLGKASSAAERRDLAAEKRDRKPPSPVVEKPNLWRREPKKNGVKFFPLKKTREGETREKDKKTLRNKKKLRKEPKKEAFPKGKGEEKKRNLTRVFLKGKD